LGLDIDCVHRQLATLTQLLRELRGRQNRFRVGALGEQRVVRVLVDMVDTNWTVLPDRHWPGSRRANIDVLLAGPGGVFVIDVKNWRDVRVEDGRLWRGQAPADEAVEKLRGQTEAVRNVLVEEGLAPDEVVPLLVLTGRRNARARLGEIQVLGELDLSLDLLRRGIRLTAAHVEQVVAALEVGCPPATAADTVAAPTAALLPRSPNPSPVGGDGDAVAADGGESVATATPGPAEGGHASIGGRPEPPLDEPLDVEQVWAALVEAAAAEPIETWMTWLHPTQARLVTRTWNGPARIRGAAGTGKTVVALHRARRLAEHGQKVLFTSFVRSLGPVFRGLFTRLAPDHAGHVEFLSVHQVAVRILRQAGVPVRLDAAALDTCWNLAWGAARRDGVLDSLGQSPGYWRDEIAHVIKGRGITDFAAYATLNRVGRHTPLHPVHREAVWRLYTDYDRRRTDRGLIDWQDVLTQALHTLHSETITLTWDAVIVDEVQDLTSTGLQLLHTIAGDGPDGLLMVGDGQQSVYPGGFTLAEAGITVTGRAVVLDRNYRNRADILHHALAMLGDDTYNDLDPTPANPRRQVHTTRPGGMIVHALADNPASLQKDLIRHLHHLREDHDARYGDAAVLVATNNASRRWHHTLITAGLPAIDLTDYDGHPTDAIKVGTFQRSKGLDFAHVLIPDADRTPAPRRPHESDDAYTERARQERRHLYVAITRARDTLWLGSTRQHAIGPIENTSGARAAPKE
jgi:hypothetical protein